MKMKTKISPAIIMRTKPFGESDLMVTFFTPDNGRVKGMAKGARRSRKRFVNCLDSFSLVNLEYVEKQRGGLYFLYSGKLINAYPGLRSDFAILSKASYMIELTEILFPLEVADPEMFELLKGSMDLLANRENVDIIPIIFEVRAMSLGGYEINFDRCCICGRPYKGEGRAVAKCDKGGIACLKCEKESAVCPGLNPKTIETIKLMGSRPLPELKTLSLADEIIAEIKPLLRLHREYHLGQRPKTACYLE